MAGPLEGRRILVTRPKRQAGDLVQRIRDLGGIPILAPAIDVAPPDGSAPLDSALQRLASYAWVVFTSANGVIAATDRMRELGVATGDLAGCRLAAIGPATARELAERCRPPDVVPDAFISDAIADVLGEVAGLRILLPRADIARRDLPIELARRGAVVDEVAAYSVRSGGDAEALAALASQPGPPDFITLTSPSAVRGLVANLREAGLDGWMRQSELVCIGPITARAVEGLGYRPGRIADEYTAEGLVAALLKGE